VWHLPHHMVRSFLGSRCKNIGHNVSICRWLYPQQSGKVNKERIDKRNKGKKPEKHQQQTSQVWQAKDNPACIGFSKAIKTPFTRNVHPQSMNILPTISNIRKDSFFRFIE